MYKYILRLHQDGDIDIIKEFVELDDYQIIYHKTYNPDDDIKENLVNAYKKWKKLLEVD